MPEITETQPPDSIPPQAFARVKAELEQAKQTLADLAPAVKQSLVVDKLHSHFKARDDLKGRDLYELAKSASGMPQVRDAEDPAKAADDWIATMSSLFTAPQGPTAPPLMAGPNPAAAGVAIESGPFAVNSKEYNAFLKPHGTAAPLQAVRPGQFFFSRENESAQQTATVLR